jgi:hypothetical protein
VDPPLERAAPPNLLWLLGSFFAAACLLLPNGRRIPCDECLLRGSNGTFPTLVATTPLSHLKTVSAA